MSKAARRKTAARRTQIESLEDRMLMAFDALDGLLGGLVSQHGAIDEGPDFVQPHVVDQPPTLAHHSGGHGLVHHGPAEHGLMHHDTPDGLPPVSHQAERSADFWLDPVGDLTGGIETTLGEIEQTLSSAHGQTGLNNVRTDYGFTGGGQTVAVIDSGIAYDHYALGGGFGANYRVVGGYDFTGGQDSDPYDGGPGGSHGTHVAGIVGSSDSTHQGVAPDVDLVGLRVFDDNGNGYFSWVENALQWVIDHRESFENPITAVNLSLGTSWNSESIPSWAMLEEEFAQLEAAGVFISVSAGNSFTSYGTPGLSYPAASPHVVPVMSTDDSGMLSYFSQRSQSAIAAPGRYIYSTVPDYAGNNNGVTDDWANFSGTSMAAPYVAGASVLVREAMQFVAMTGINQDTIYNHMLATADSVYDSSTGLSYSRLNVEAAIDALMPVDDYGSTEATAYDLGQITGTLAGPSQASSSVMQMNGVISTLDDTDYFTFTAGSTGTVTFTASGATHDLDASWQGFGGEGWSHASGDAYTMHVIAGQQYSVAISSTDGLGYYNLDVSAEAAFTFTDWGALAGQQTYTGLESSGANWYRFVVGQDGYVTLDPGAGSTGDLAAISVSLHDANQNAIGAQNGAFRIDHYATAGDELYVRVDGDASQIGIRLTNLVSVAGAAVTVAGTSAADDLAFAAGSGSHTVTVNGLAYSFDSTQHTSFSLAGGGGADVVTLTGGAGDDTAWLGGAASLTGAGYSATATGYARVNAYGGAGGNDTLNFQDTSGDDVVALRPGQNDAYMAGGGVFAYAYGFDRVNAYATAGGYDRVDFQDTAGDDSVTFRPQENDAFMNGGGVFSYASGFERVNAFSTAGGQDTAAFYDTSGNDTVTFRPGEDDAYMVGGGVFSYASGFARLNAFATAGGYDSVEFLDTAGNDTVNFRPQSNDAFMAAPEVFSYAWGFERVNATSSAGGYDKVEFYDTAGNDLVTFRPQDDDAFMNAAGVFSYATGFDRVHALSANGGYDRVEFLDTTGDDHLIFRPSQNDAYMTAAGVFSYAWGFDRVHGTASLGGYDRVDFYDTAGDDHLTFRPSETDAYMSAAGVFSYAHGFERVNGYATLGGYDRVDFLDTAGDDHLTFRPGEKDAFMTAAGVFSYAWGFERANGFSTLGGDDRVDFYDTSGNDRYTARAAERDAFMSGAGYFNYAHGFNRFEGYSSSGADTAELYDSLADDVLQASGSTAELSAEGRQYKATDFGAVRAHSVSGGSDTATVGAVDYAFDEIGGWS